MNVCSSMKDVFPAVAAGTIESSKQGGLQALSLLVTLGMALLGGLIVGESGGPKCFWFHLLTYSLYRCEV